MYETILEKCSKQDLIEIYSHLNHWEWSYKLGDKPNEWDSMPDYIMNNHHDFPTKRDIIKPIINYINQKVSEKDLLKYHQLTNCNMTRLQHEIWWLKRQLSKLFGIGFYSKKTQLMIKQVLGDLAEKDHKKWIYETYGGR